MANRYFNQFSKTLENEVVTIFARVSFAGASAPTLDTTISKGIVSVTHLGVGQFKFIFGTRTGMLDVYYKCLGIDLVFDQTGQGGIVPASQIPFIASNQIATTSAYLNINIFDANGGSLVDPASGDVGLFTFRFKNSTAP